MNRERADERRGRAASSARTRQSGQLATELLHLRSYDHRRGYDLDVEARSVDGGRAVERRYYLQPGEAVSERNVLPPGVYELTVTLDNDEEKRLRCRLDASPDHTAVVEVGNGVISLTRGLAP